MDEGSLINDSEHMLAKEIEKVVSSEPSKSKSLRPTLHQLFTPHGRLIVATLRDIQEEQHRISNNITSIRVHD